MSNERAEALLVQAKLQFEREPSWIKKGQRPDFFCSGTGDFWCEVKTLEPTDDFTQTANFHEELRNRTSDLKMSGKGIAYVGDSLTSGEAKILTELLKRALPRLGEPNGPQQVVAMVPNDANCQNFVRFTILAKDGLSAEFHTCVSTTGKYGCPFQLSPKPPSQTTQMRFSSGEEKSALVTNVLKWSDDFRAAIVAWSDDKPFSLIATTSTGMARKIRTPERIREVLADANGQFRNAVSYRSAPTLLMLFHDGIDVPRDDEIVKSALYGDLKYSFAPNDFENGKLILQGNGAWNAGKNRTTSAVMYVRNGGTPLIVHNHWARLQFPRNVFSYKEIIPNENGTFDTI